MKCLGTLKDHPADNPPDTSPSTRWRKDGVFRKMVHKKKRVLTCSWQLFPPRFRRARFFAAIWNCCLDRLRCRITLPFITYNPCLLLKPLYPSFYIFFLLFRGKVLALWKTLIFNYRILFTVHIAGCCNEWIGARSIQNTVARPYLAACIETVLVLAWKWAAR